MRFRVAGVMLFVGLSVVSCIKREPAALRSVDGTLELALPAGWEESSHKAASAQIQATNAEKHLYVEVLSEPRADFNATLAQYAAGRQGHVVTALKDSGSSAPQNVQVGDFPAVQYEIHGTSAKSELKLGYVLTVVQTQHYYVQVVGWTTESHYADGVEELKKIPAGIREVAK
jgi:hypothetical protein